MGDMQSITYLEGAEHAAADLRLVHRSLIGVPGIASPEALQVTETPGTPDMAVRVAAGGVWLAGTQASDQGVYHAVLTSAATLPVAPGDSTNARVDLVVARVRDQFYAGSEDRAQVTIVTGTAAAVPAEPAVPANSEVLARINVPAGEAEIANAQLVDRRVSAKLRGSLLAGADLGTFTPTQDGHLVTRAHMRDYVARAAPYELRSRTTTTADQNIPESAVTSINVDNPTHHDRQGFWTAANTTYTIVQPGVYEVEAGVRWQSSATGTRQLLIAVNGAFAAGTRVNAAVTGAFDMSICRTVALQAGDSLAAQVVQTSGGTLGIAAAERTYRNIRYLRPT